MKPLLLALVPASCAAAQTPPPNATVSGSVTGTFKGEPEVLKPEGEAISHFLKALEDFKGISMKAIYSAFGILMESGERNESFAKMAPMMKLFAEHSGSLVKVDKCLGPKLGDTI